MFEKLFVILFAKEIKVDLKSKKTCVKNQEN